MVKHIGYPDPLEPGKFGLRVFSGYNAYCARWAGHKWLVKKIRAGDYRSITPIFSEFIPTLRCTFRCPTCAYKAPKEKVGLWQRESDLMLFSDDIDLIEMSLNRARHYLNKLYDDGCRAILLTGGGEPTLHNNLREIVRHALLQGMRIGMSTNGTFAGKGFDPEDVINFGFDFVRISIDSLSHHDTFHGYEKKNADWLPVCLDNLARICDAKRNTDRYSEEMTKVVICMVFDERNYAEFETIGESLSTFRGVDWVVVRPVIDYYGEKQVPESIVRQVQEMVDTKFRPAMQRINADVFMPPHRQITLGGAERNYKLCRACGLYGGVWSDGRMFICTETNGFDDFCIGEMQTQTLADIYCSSRYTSVRTRVEGENFCHCPVTCRPTSMNTLFEKIEQLKQQPYGPELLDDWLTALETLSFIGNPWIGA